MIVAWSETLAPGLIAPCERVVVSVVGAPQWIVACAPALWPALWIVAVFSMHDRVRTGGCGAGDRLAVVDGPPGAEVEGLPVGVADGD